MDHVLPAVSYKFTPTPSVHLFPDADNHYSSLPPQTTTGIVVVLFDNVLYHGYSQNEMKNETNTDPRCIIA